MIAAERLKMEKMFLEFNRNNNEPETDSQSPPQQGSQTVSIYCLKLHKFIAFVYYFQFVPLLYDFLLEQLFVI